MPAPSVLFTAEEVMNILAHEAVKVLSICGEGMEVEMQTSIADNAVEKVRITFLESSK